MLFQRLIQDVQTYVEQLGEECAASVAVPRRAAFLFVVVTAFCMALKKIVPLEVSLAVQMLSQLNDCFYFAAITGTISCPAHVRWLSSAAWIPLTCSIKG